jgi:hypothetical protein
MSTRRSRLILPVPERDHIAGTPEAPPALVEYGDFDVYEFMALFAQPTRTRAAVEYVPVPYRGARQRRADG